MRIHGHQAYGNYKQIKHSDILTAPVIAHPPRSRWHMIPEKHRFLILCMEGELLSFLEVNTL
jgi:hypothetical protein